jgi:hypothetical protein
MINFRKTIATSLVFASIGMGVAATSTPLNFSTGRLLPALAISFALGVRASGANTY